LPATSSISASGNDLFAVRLTAYNRTRRLIRRCFVRFQGLKINRPSEGFRGACDPSTEMQMGLDCRGDRKALGLPLGSCIRHCPRSSQAISASWEAAWPSMSIRPALVAAALGAWRAVFHGAEGRFFWFNGNRVVPVCYLIGFTASLEL